MSSGYLGKTTNRPDDIAGAQDRNEREDVWGEMQGKVVSFDKDKQTATVQPLMKKNINGVMLDLPELQEVPVRQPRAGGGALTMPIKEGDLLSLRPLMRSAEDYHEAGGAYAPSTLRSHSLSDMEAHLDGGEPLSDPIKNFDGANVHLRFDDEGKFGIRGSSDGKLKIEGSQGNVYALLAEFMELVASDNHQGQSHEHKAQMTAIAAKVRAMAL